MSDKEFKVHQFSTTSKGSLSMNLDRFYLELEKLLNKGWKIQDQHSVSNDDAVVICFILERLQSSNHKIEEK